MDDLTPIPFDPGHDDSEQGSDNRFRTFMVLCYPDNEEHSRWFAEVLPKLSMDYVGILHDKDEGSKPHHHIVFYFKNARWRDAFISELGMDARWVRCWDSKIKAFQYLLHRGYAHKYQYPDSELYGTLADDCAKVCGRASPADEAKQAKQVFELLTSIDGYVSVNSFALMAIENNLWSTFRRMGNLAIRALDQHNSAYQQTIVRESEVAAFGRAIVTDHGLTFDQRCELLDRLGFLPKGGLSDEN